MLPHVSDLAAYGTGNQDVVRVTTETKWAQREEGADDDFPRRKLVHSQTVVV